MLAFLVNSWIDLLDLQVFYHVFFYRFHLSKVVFSMHLLILEISSYSWMVCPFSCINPLGDFDSMIDAHKKSSGTSSYEQFQPFFLKVPSPFPLGSCADSLHSPSPALYSALWLLSPIIPIANFENIRC